MKKSIKMILLFILFIAITNLIWFKVLVQILKITNGNFTEHVPLYTDLETSNNMKYILQWTRPFTEPFKFMGKGQETFINGHCSYNNCYVTSDKKYLPSLTAFHVILFHGPELHREKIPNPDVRMATQKYVFASMESSDYYPMCDDRYRGFFNWTWTYKLGSDLYYGYVIIKNKEGEVLGPREEMHWMSVDEMIPVDEKLKARLSSKKLAAAWFVSNCNAPSGRMNFAEQLQQELAINYNLTLDIYGACGPKKCLKNNMNECLQMIDNDYYFYLSFENSFSEDYVTEKLLNALQHHAIPVVFGGANYTRFMPDGIYLDGRKLGVTLLAQTMADIILDHEKYYKFFRWHNHYSYHYVSESSETDYYCQLCSKLNSESFNETTIYDDFAKWWNPPKIRSHVC